MSHFTCNIVRYNRENDGALTCYVAEMIAQCTRKRSVSGPGWPIGPT